MFAKLFEAAASGRGRGWSRSFPPALPHAHGLTASTLARLWRSPSHVTRKKVRRRTLESAIVQKARERVRMFWFLKSGTIARRDFLKGSNSDIAWREKSACPCLCYTFCISYFDCKDDQSYHWYVLSLVPCHSYYTRDVLFVVCILSSQPCKQLPSKFPSSLLWIFWKVSFIILLNLIFSITNNF